MQSERKLPLTGQQLKKKILIVDDQEMGLISISSHFNKNIYEVYTACSGEMALELIRHLAPNCFDAILTDFNMPPGMNGGTFIQQCRLLPAYQNKPILIISGELSHMLQKVANEVGANAYFTKPVLSKNLLGYLEPIFQQQDEGLGLTGEH